MPSSRELSIEFSPAAVEDMREAIVWYRQQSRTAATLFYQDVERVMDLIADFPDIGRDLGYSRRMPLGRFPYSILYRITEENLLVTAVAHFRKSPLGRD